METEKTSLWDLVKFALPLIAAAVLFRMYVAQPFIVSGASMEPTYYNGDYLIINELSYQFSQPQKDDVIVFKYPLNPSKYFIKRVVGLPGETIETDGKTTTLKEGEYFVMGDNRGASSDSRIWGAVPRENIIGKTFVQLFSSKKIAEAFSGAKSFVFGD